MALPLTDRTDFDEKFYKLIGQIVVAFNSLEALLRACIAGSLGGNADLGSVVLCRVGFTDLVKMFGVSARFVNADPTEAIPELEEPRISDLVKTLNAACEKRNQIVHSQYGERLEFVVEGDGELGETKRFLERTKLKHELEHALYPSSASKPIDSLSELESVLDLIKNAYSELSRIEVHLVKPWWANIDFASEPE